MPLPHICSAVSSILALSRDTSEANRADFFTNQTESSAPISSGSVRSVRFHIRTFMQWKTEVATKEKNEGKLSHYLNYFASTIFIHRSIGLLKRTGNPVDGRTFREMVSNCLT